MENKKEDKKNKEEVKNSHTNNENQTQDKKDKREKQQKEEKPKTLEEKYEELEKDYKKLQEKYIRKIAEFENFRKRTAKEKSDWIKNATKRLVLDICDVMDNFERALEQKKENDKKGSFRTGIEMIFKQLEKILANEGVKKIEALDQEFDPNYHEALAHIESDKEENRVVGIIQNGYLMNDKVIRAARVAVSKGKEKKSKKKNKKNKKNK